MMALKSPLRFTTALFLLLALLFHRSLLGLCESSPPPKEGGKATYRLAFRQSRQAWMARCRRRAAPP